MKKIFLILFCVFCSTLLFAQGKGGATNDVIVRTGNLGIGTTTPAAKLDVLGNSILKGIIKTNANNYGGEHFGDSALFFINNSYDASSCTGIGKSAGNRSQTSGGGTYIGAYAGYYNVSGDYNTYVGAASGIRNLKDYNTFVGFNTGFYNVIGEKNTIIGSNAGTHAAWNKSNCIFIGTNAGNKETQGNKLYIEGYNSIADSTTSTIYADMKNHFINFYNKVSINGTANASQTENLWVNGTMKLQGGATIDTIETTLTNSATNIPTSSAVFSGLAGKANVSDSGMWTLNGIDISSKNSGNVGIGIINPSKKLDINGITRTKGITSNRVSANYNQMFGDSAGNVSMTGVANTLVGTATGNELTNGATNSYFGAFAGWHTTTGSLNTSIGASAGTVNLKGNNNTYIGAYAGAYDTSGSYNTYVGFNSGGRYFGGGYNGYGNTYIGNESGHLAVGSKNIFIGDSAGYNQIGDNRLIIANTTADSTTALFYGAFDRGYLRQNADVHIGKSLRLKNATQVDTIETSLTNSATNIPTSSAVLLWTNLRLSDSLINAYEDIKKLQDSIANIYTEGQVDYLLGLKANIEDSGMWAVNGADIYGKNSGNVGIGITNPTYKLQVDSMTSTKGITSNKGSDINNEMFGLNAGNGSVHGQQNTFVGYGAGFVLDSGYNNTFIGGQSAAQFDSGSSNTFVGNGVAANLIRGNENSLFGYFAGISITRGNKNTLIGNNAGGTFTTGNNNTCIGYNAGVGNLSGSGNVYIGYNAGSDIIGGVNENNKLYISNVSSDSTNTLIYGDFARDYLRLNANVGIGYAKPSCALAVNGNVGIGTTSPAGKLQVGYDIIGDDSTSIITNAGVLGLGTTAPSGRFHVKNSVTGNDSDFCVRKSGRVGIGTTNPLSTIHLWTSNGQTARLRMGHSENGRAALADSMSGLELQMTSVTANQYSPVIKFQSNDAQLTTTTPKPFAMIAGRATQTYDDDNDGGGAIDFATNANNPGATAIPTVRMTIDQSGNVGIGSTVPTHKLKVTGGYAMADSLIIPNTKPKAPVAGAMRWSNDTLYFYNGSAWKWAVFN